MDDIRGNLGHQDSSYIIWGIIADGRAIAGGIRLAIAGCGSIVGGGGIPSVSRSPVAGGRSGVSSGRGGGGVISVVMTSAVSEDSSKEGEGLDSELKLVNIFERFTLNVNISNHSNLLPTYNFHC